MCRFLSLLARASYLFSFFLIYFIGCDLALAGDNAGDLIIVKIADGGLIEIKSKTDSITINGISINRGNCKVYDVPLPDQSNQKEMMAMGLRIDPTLKSKGEILKFADKVLFKADFSCEILEITVQTSSGDISVEVD